MNPAGLMSVNPIDGVNVLCCPAELQANKDLGNVQIWNLDNLIDPCKIVRGHSSALSILELNYDGSLMATASEKGTIIRIFSTKNGDKLQELRRGSENAVLFSVDFLFHEDWLACISDSGTLHIFNLTKNPQEGQNPTAQKAAQQNAAKNSVSKNRKSM